MKTRYLFPHRFKKLGWILLVPSLVLGLLLINEMISFPWLDMDMFAIYDPAMLGDPENESEVFKFRNTNVADEIIASLLIISTLLVACSEVKEEDEYIAKLRLESLLWSLYVNAAFLIFCILFVYGIGFYQIMVYNLFTLMLLFLIRFHIVLYKASKQTAYEE